MQDMHVPEGLFGYFPCCTISAMHAAQGPVAAHFLQPAFDARAP
jgi:carboxypeptidase Taq